MTDSDFFDSRPTITEKCTRCNGRGHFRKPYTLTYYSGMPECPENCIPALPLGSVSVFECTKEASEVAQKARKTVVFKFIDHMVAVKPDSDPVQVAHAWWEKQYGETYEQFKERWLREH